MEKQTNSLCNIRKLLISDLDPHSGFYDTLKQLNSDGNIDLDKAQNLFNELQNDVNHFIFVAIVDSGFSPIVGTATLRVEKQFLHDCSQYGVIDNVCVREEFKGMHIGFSLIQHIINIAKEKKCYKVVLNCKNSIVPFYEKNGFYKHDNEMRFDFKK